MTRPAAARWRAIRRRWPAIAWDLAGTSRRAWGGRQWGYVMATASLVAVSYLDVSLLTGRGEAWWPASSLHERTMGRLVLVMLLAVNGLVVVAVAGAESPRPGWWERVIRASLGWIPVVGLLSLPFAARGAARRVLSAAERLPAEGPRGSGVGVWRRLRHLVRSGRGRRGAVVGWLVGCQILPFLALLSWLVSSSTASSPARSLAVAVSIAFHGLLAEATRRHLISLARSESGGAMGLLLRLGPLPALLPGPAALLGIVLWLPWARENRDEKTLVHAAFDRRARADALSASRAPVGQQMQEARLPAGPAAGSASRAGTSPRSDSRA